MAPKTAQIADLPPARSTVIDRPEAALILVDVQPDFMPGGALPVPRGHEILGPIRTLMRRDLFGLSVATQDWHPPGHVSFASQHHGKQPLDVIELYGHDQTLWPDHCVQGTSGAALHPALPWDGVSLVLRKGEDPACDSYSGFRNNWNAMGARPLTGLAGYLNERNIRQVAVCGLARDVCVKWTALDAARSGFDTYVIWDLARSVAPSADATVRAELEAAGARIVESREF